MCWEGVAGGNLAANGCDGGNGLGGAESCSSALCVKGKQGQSVGGLATLIQSCLRHSSRGDLDATAGKVWPRPKF